MVEEERHLKFQIPKQADGLASRRSGPNLSERNQAMINLLNSSRVGQFVDVDLLNKGIEEFIRKRIEAYTHGERMGTSLRNDMRIRLDLIRRDGQESIGHLTVVTDTLNALMRLSEVAVDLDVLKISGLRRMLLDGVTVRPNGYFQGYDMNKGRMVDIDSALKQFDSL